MTGDLRHGGVDTRTLTIAAALGILAAASAVGVGVVLLPLAFVLVALGGIILVLAVNVRWPYFAIIVVLLVVTIPRYTSDYNGLTVSAERITMPFIAAAALVSLLVRKRTVLSLGWTHVLVLGYAAVLALSSLLVAPDKGNSLKLTLLVCLVMIPLWVAPSLVARPVWLKFAVLAFFAAAAVESVVGLAFFLAHSLFGTTIGLQRDSLTNILTPGGTQVEGNIFGSFVAAGFVGWLAWIGGRTTRLRWHVDLIPLALMGAGVIFSYSRGAWLGAAAGAGVAVLAVAPRARVRAFATIGALGAVTIALIVAVGGSPYTQALVTRGASLSNIYLASTTGPRAQQLYTQNIIVRNIARSPLIGTGAGSLGEQFQSPTVNQPAWNGNLELHIANDAGLLGVVLFGLAVATIVVPLVLNLRTSSLGLERRLTASALSMMVSTLVAFQATEATYLAWSWWVFGLAWAATQLRRRPASSRDPVAIDTPVVLRI